MLRSKFTKFNRGEVDEKAMARDDVARIYESSSLMENFVPQRLGPMQYRAGSEFLDAAFTNVEHYQIPFLSKGNENAVLEFSAADDATGTNTLRIWIDDALMTLTATVDTITNPTFATDIASWTDDSDAGGAIAWGGAGIETLDINGNGSGDWGRAYQTNLLTAGERTVEVWIAEAPVFLSIGTGGTQSNDVFSGWLNPGYHALTFTATAVNHTFTFQNDKAFIGRVQSIDYHAGGVFSLTGPFWEDSSATGEVMKTVRYAQSADVMYVTSNGYELEGRAWPYIMFLRRATKSWSFVVPESNDGPFGPINISSTTLTPAATNGNTTLTASVAIFKSTAVGDAYELIHGATVGRCIVTAYTSATVVEVRVVADFGGITATADWYTGTFGYYLPGPTAVEMFEGRMWLAGAGDIHGSVADQYTSFDARLEGSEAAIQRTIGFGAVQDISWLLGGDQLLMGLSSEELTVNSNEFGDIITPTNARIRRGTSHGSAVMKPLVINKIVYFAQRALKKIIAMTGLSKEGVKTEDITLLTPEILSPGIKRIAYVGEPEPRIWVLLTDGELRVYLFDEAEDVRGWSRVTIGGGGTIVDIVSIPTNEQDAVYIIVDRSGSRTVEKFANFEDAIGQSDSRHYDSHIYYASPGTTITGLDHLEGLVVNVWGDGIDREVQLVAGGQITVTTAWADVVVGVRHTAKYLSNRLSRYLANSVLTDEKRVVRMGLIMHAVALRTIKYGPSESILQNMPEIEEGRLRAPTTEPEAQIIDTIDGASAGAIDAWGITIQDLHAYCMCQTVPQAAVADFQQYMVYSNGILYMVGGATDAGAAQDELWSYNIATGEILQLTSAPAIMSTHAVCEHDGVIYVLHAEATHKLMAYDIATNAWLTVAQPTTSYDEAACVAYDGNLYLYGGSSGGTPQTNWGIYDIGLDSWDYTAVIGTIEAKKQHCMAAPQSGTGAGKLYIFGGLGPGATTDSKNFYEYDIGTNTMSALDSTVQVARQYSKLEAPGDGYLYNWGGKPRVGIGNYEPDLYRYDITGDAWTVINTVTDEGDTEPWILTHFGMAWDTVNGRMYIYGGYNYNAPPDGAEGYPLDMWYYDLAGDDWTFVFNGMSTPAGALRVVGIADPAELENTFALNLESADQSLYGYSSVESGDYLYCIVEEENSDNRGLAVVDISDPTAPVQVGYLEGGVNTTTIGRAIAIDGNTVYAQSFATDGSLASIDVSDPTTPVLLDELVLTFDVAAVNSEKMAPVWPRLYIPWEDDLHIVDVSDPSAMALESTFALPGGANNNQCMTETDATLWVLDTGGSLSSFDLANPALPVLIGGLVDAVNLSNVEDMGIAQPYLYAMQATVGHVIDLTDPTAPVLFVSYTGFVGLKSFAHNGSNQLFAGSITDEGTFYSADQRANRYVDYDERPFEFDGEYDTDSRLYLQAQGPATILAITYDVEDSDNQADDSTEPRNN